MKDRIFIAFITLWISNLTAQDFSAEICTWKYDKSAAVSITFDDASFTQYEYAYPILSKYHFKATYSLVGEWTKEQPSYSSEPGIFKIKKMGWQQIRKLHKAGNEIASHGYRHQRYGKRLPLDTLVSQMKKAKRLIESHIDDTCYTLQYPYSFTSNKITLAAKKAGYWFGRTGSETYNNATPENLFLLKTKAILSDTIPALQEFDNWLQQANGKWLILMYHHLFPKGSKEMHILNYHKIQHTYSLLPDTFDKQMQSLSNFNYWVAPVKTVGKYVVERQNTQIKVHRCLGRFVIKLQSELSNKYSEALTVRIKVPWEKVKVKMNGRENIYYSEQGKLLLEALPNSIIIIKKEK